jgi:pyruvate/2-oxoglutarate dehydrogenase complex dihydrolipoamide dehydrogenase (E3) component
MELAQSMARFGCKVTCIDRDSRILGREDEEASKILSDKLKSEGVTFIHNAVIQSVDSSTTGELYKEPFKKYKLRYTTMNGGKSSTTLEFDSILVAAGRVPNVENIGLEKVEVEYDKKFGIIVNEEYRTTAKNGNIYATGDCVSPYKFTHSADWQARSAIRNMFLGTTEKLSDLLIPWSTYTDPEVAHVGLYEKDMVQRNIDFIVCRQDLEHVDRCICEGVSDGFVKLFVSTTGEIFGATIVAPNAGDMISEITLAIQCNITVQQLSGVIHPYPTTQESVRQAASKFLKTLKTPVVNRTIEFVLDQHKMRENSYSWWKEVLDAAQTTK